jgi:hypothetical protein
MRSATKLASHLIFSEVVVILITWLAARPTPAAGQTPTPGNNAVYYQSGSSGVCCKGSGAFIDATVFATSVDTICSAIYKIMLPTGYSAAVIDARGLPGVTGASMTCAPGTTPWNNGTTFLNKPATILLPAGTIVIPTTWVLPQNTRLIGVGDSISNLSGGGTTTVGTTIQACKSVVNVECPVLVASLSLSDGAGPFPTSIRTTSSR